MKKTGILDFGTVPYFDQLLNAYKELQNPKELKEIGKVLQYNVINHSDFRFLTSFMAESIRINVLSPQSGTNKEKGKRFYIPLTGNTLVYWNEWHELERKHLYYSEGVNATFNKTDKESAYLVINAENKTLIHGVKIPPINTNK